MICLLLLLVATTVALSPTPAPTTKENLCWGYFDGHDGYKFPTNDKATVDAIKKAYEIIYSHHLAPEEIKQRLREWKKQQNPEVVLKLKEQKEKLLEDHKTLLAKMHNVIEALPGLYNKLITVMNRKQLSPRARLNEAHAILKKSDPAVANGLRGIFNATGCPLPIEVHV